MKILCLIFTALIIKFELLAQTAVINIFPISQTIEVSLTADVIVKLENIQQLHAYSVEISYDPLLLRYLGLMRKDFLSGWQTFFFPFIDTINGKIKVDEAILGPYVQSGSGEIFKISFEGKTEGICNLTISQNELRDLDNQKISALTNNAVVQIRFPLSVINELESDELCWKLKIFPNPFNSSASIEFESGTEEINSIKILNCNGEQVYNHFINSSDRTLKFRWDGKDKNGKTLPSGVYLVLAETSSSFLVKKIMMLK